MPRTLLIAIVIGLAAVIIAGVGFTILLNFLEPVSENEETKSFTVTAGESVEVIAQHLEEAGLIRNASVFTFYVRGERLTDRLQAGEYLLSPSMDSPAIARALASGEALNREVTIRLLEGWSNDEIGRYLADEKKLFTFEEWESAASVNDSRSILSDRTFDFLADKSSGATLEGYLYPDTYRVFRDAEPADVVAKMLENFGEKMSPELRTAVAAQGKSIFEVIILASIVEREVLSDADMRKAADVFWKRLREGIALQSDATVNYVTGKKSTRPSFDDLAVDSPYNTYKYPGLPPGPIGNPSLAAIKAVIEPEPNPYYYFLTADTGEAIFSRTLDEHNANKVKYLGG